MLKRPPRRSEGSVRLNATDAIVAIGSRLLQCKDGSRLIFFHVNTASVYVSDRDPSCFCTEQLSKQAIRVCNAMLRRLSGPLTSLFSAEESHLCLLKTNTALRSKCCPEIQCF